MGSCFCEADFIANGYGNRDHLDKVGHNFEWAKIKIENLSTALKTEILTMLNMTEPELEALINKANQFIARAAKSSSPFANMVRCKYPGLQR